MKERALRFLKSAKLFEFLMIFAGITLSMQFDNWNENRKLRQKEVEFLKLLYIDICNDQKDVIGIIEDYDRYYLAPFTILDSCLHHKLEKKEYNDILIPIGSSYINQDKGAYESLKYEDSNVFRNIKLKVQIYDYYEASLNKMEAFFELKIDISHEYVIPLTFKYCNSKFQLNYEKYCQLRQDEPSLMILEIWHQTYKEMKEEYKILHQQQQKLKLALEQELRKYDIDCKTVYSF